MTDPVQKYKFLTPLMSATPSVQKVKGGGNPKPDQLRQACRDFESIFTQQMMQQMRRTIPQNGLFNGGQAEQIYTSMLDGELSKTMAQGRGLGLADVMYRQLSALRHDAVDED